MPRQQSIETQLRSAKREASNYKAAFEDNFARWKTRKLVGSQMSNVLYNIAQKREFNDHDREMCTNLQKQWDEVSRG